MTTADGATERAAARHRWVMLGIVLIVQFMVILDVTIVSVALPSIQNGLHFGSQLVAQSPGMLIGGRVAQGLGAAMVSPAVLSIILVAFTRSAPPSGSPPSPWWRRRAPATSSARQAARRRLASVRWR